MELPTIAHAITWLTHPITTAVVGFGTGLVSRFFYDRFQRRDNAGAALSTAIGRRYFATRNNGLGQARMLSDSERRELSLVMSRRKFVRLHRADHAYAECHARNLVQRPGAKFDDPVVLNASEVEAAAQRVLAALPGL